MQGIIIISILFSFASVVLSDVDVSVSVDEDLIAEGDSANVKCTIKEHQSDWLVHWYKRQAEGQVVQMGTNTDINKIFSDTGRYKGKKETAADGTPSFILTITDAVAEDSGDIGCYVPDSGVEEKKYAKLVVAVPVQSIALYGLNAEGSQIKEYTNGETVQFEEGEKYYFRCVASGSNPAPDITLHLGDDDVSDDFEYNKTYSVEGGQPGLKRVTFRAEQRITTHPIVIDKKQNGHQFKCTAGVEGTEDKTIYIVPMMKFLPVVTCEETKYNLPSMYKDLEFDCTVKADPTPEHIAVYWQEKDGTNRTLTEDSKSFGNYRMSIKEGDNPDEQVVTIYVERVFPQMFRKYTFIAQSSVGDVTQTIELIRDLSQESGSSHITLSAWLLTLIFTFYFIV